MISKSQGNGETGKKLNPGSGSNAKPKKRWSWKRTPSRTYELFHGSSPEENVISVGGLEIKTPLPENLLPAEALLLKPTVEEIRNNDLRMIHLSTPLLDSEQKLLKALDEECKKQRVTIPRSMQPHCLRVIQQHKGKVKAALDQIQKNYEFRMKYLPLSDTEVVADLHKGWMYWHGRDKRCRPILFVRAGNMDKETWANPERITKMILFLLEFILRYGMVPGRVENWCVVVDLTHAGRHGRPSMDAVKSMANAMQGIYRYRMAWTKILNAPWWFSMIWSGLKTVLPGESIKKVEICSGSYHKALHAVVALNQLEERYGGTCRDRDNPADFYPMYFPPGPFNPEAAELRMPASPRCGATTDIRARLHDYTPVTLHEGGLWIEGKEEKWLPTTHLATLTKEASDYLKERNIPSKPCETYEDLLSLLRQLQGDTTDTPSEDSKSPARSQRQNEEVLLNAGSASLKAKDASDRSSPRATATLESGIHAETKTKRESNGVPRISAPMAAQLSRDRDKIPSRDRKNKTSFAEALEALEEDAPELRVIPSREVDNTEAYGTCGFCSCRPCRR